VITFLLLYLINSSILVKLILANRTLQIAIIGIIVTVLIIPLSMVTNVDGAADLPYNLRNNPPMISRGDTFADLQIRAVFHFAQGTSIVDSFHIFEQTPGAYTFTGTKAFTLIGGISPDKIMLYNVIDNAHHKRHHDTAAALFRDFDVEVMLMNEETTYRHFSYKDCNVDDYNITTLFDGEETFSNPDLKFVVADVVNFECEDYHPHCPYCEEMFNPKLKEKTTISSGDYQDEQRSTWPEYWQ